MFSCYVHQGKYILGLGNWDPQMGQVTQSSAQSGPFGVKQISSSFSTHWQLYAMILLLYYYRQTSNISHTLVGNKLADHSDVVGASAVGAAPTTSSSPDCSFST